MNYLYKLRYIPVKLAAGTRHVTMYRLLTLLILYKSYSYYQSTRRVQILKYRELWENGLANNLLIDAGLLVENFKPSYCLLSGTSQTLFAGIARWDAPDYTKEILRLPDGGQIALQSIVHPNSKGIIVVVPGICGDGFAAYIVNTVNKAVENGYSVVVVNHRGLCETKLLTPHTYHGGSSNDTKAAIDYINSKFPDQPLYGISFSLGSNILGRYLGEQGEQSKLSGAIWICCPFNSLEASSYSERSCFGLVSRYLAWNAKRMLAQQAEILPLLKEVHEIDFDVIQKKWKRFRDFDDLVTARMFGFSGVIDYYTKWSITPVLKNIRTKTLFISALDDPFFGPDVIPFTEFENNENIYLMATTGGGHVGFYDTIFSKEQWHNKPAYKFIDYLNTIDRCFLNP